MKLLSKIIFITIIAGTFVACNSNSSMVDEDPLIPEVEVNTQGTDNGNKVNISTVVSPDDGWIVIHRSNEAGDGPQVPEIIGKAMVDAGTNTDVTLQLEEGVANDETLWAMLHEDTGTVGEYEFDGENGLDLPVTFDEEIVMSSFTITQTDPAIRVEDQVNKGNIFTVSVDAAEDGWIVIHGPNANNDG
ncbi:MAG: hypothetical protein RI564_13525, partial [Gracilimonas sp.]|nr:hypothetical protein [Gracilimonas sp.]